MWLSKQDTVSLMPWEVSKQACSCWEGYERVPGTKPCSSNSCRKKSLTKHLEGKHDQSQHGQWAQGRGGERDTGGAATAEADFETGVVLEGTTAEGIYSRMLAEEGISLNFRGKAPDSGYMVARVGHEVKIPEGEFSPEHIAEYLRQTRDKFGPPERDTQMGRIDRERTYFGGWLEDGNWYLDISDMVPTLGPAALRSEQNNQLALWDVENGRALSAKDPEYRRAMRDEMMRQERRRVRETRGVLAVEEVADRQRQEIEEEWSGV